jgi:hypothetical protein
MTEAELIELDFEISIIENKESQNGYDYYYYHKELCDDLVLYSTDSTDVKDNNWTLKCYEIPSIRIKTMEHYLQFVEVLKNVICIAED